MLTTERVLAIEPNTWTEMLALKARVDAGTISPAQAAASVGLSRPALAEAHGSVAVIPLMGLLTPRGGGIWGMLFGGTSLAGFRAAVQEAAANRSVTSILLLVDSPGGSVTGTIEAADAVAAARRTKRIVAVADGMAASAAYWISSQASEIIASPSAQLGALGVLSVHEDVSRAMDAAGVTITQITSSPYKAEGSPFTPLSAEARADLQRIVNHYGDIFVRAVATGRGVSDAHVRADYGRGRVLTTQDAVRVGMVDRVATVEAALARETRAPLEAAAHDRTMAFHFELLTRGIASPPPRRVRDHDEATDLRLRLAELGR